MDILLMIHSMVRWTIILIAVIAVIKFIMALVTNALFKGMDRGLSSGYSGLMDLQVTVGLIYFIWNGIMVEGFPAYRILHIIVMIIAAALGHIPSRFKSMPDKPRFQYSLFAIIGSLVLIGIGISLLPR